jgi:hypothetical protein
MSAEPGYIQRRPWLLVVYLLAITLAAFFTPDAWKPAVVTSLIILQFGILAWNRKLDRSSVRIFERLKFLFIFLVAANALLPGDPSHAYWEPVSWLRVDLTGARLGVLMCAQILLVVLTTHVVRSIGDERSFINGLRSLRVAPLLAYSLDTTLALLDGSLRKTGGGGGMGRGDGSGGGGGHHARRGSWLRLFRRKPPADPASAEAERASDAEPTGMLALFRALKRRDLSPFVNKINQGLRDAANHAERLGLSERRAHDVGVIGGVSAAMMAFKLVKFLPGVPALAGMKTVFFIPLYMLAADRTYSRWGATMAGGIMGFIAFLNGDSRYGIFEVLKHVVPGLVIDLVWPLARKFKLRFSVLLVVGLLAGAARTSTQFAMVLLLGADKASLYLLPAARLPTNLIAGFLSIFVSYAVLKALGSRAVEEQETQPGGAEVAPSVELVKCD